MCLLTTPNINCFLGFEYVGVVSITCAIEEKANEWFLILHVLVMPGQSSFALGRACACHTRITRVSHLTVCLMRNILSANCTLRPTGTVHISLVPRPFPLPPGNKAKYIIICMCIHRLRLTLSCILLAFA